MRSTDLREMYILRCTLKFCVISIIPSCEMIRISDLFVHRRRNYVYFEYLVNICHTEFCENRRKVWESRPLDSETVVLRKWNTQRRIRFLNDIVS